MLFVVDQAGKADHIRGAGSSLIGENEAGDGFNAFGGRPSEFSHAMLKW